MHRVVFDPEADFSAWRLKARDLLSRGLPPHALTWSAQAGGDLFGGMDDMLPPVMEGAHFMVPRHFIELGQTVIMHRAPQRFAWLYAMLWRLQEEPRLLDVQVDPDVARLEGMAKAVRRDIHKMRAFVRFRKTTLDEREWYVAWFEPDHLIVRANAPFFMRRFTTMHWSILTPCVSAHWDGINLSFGSGAARHDAPDGDALENLWRGYYASIFNPARLKINAMRSEMPRKYWKNLPEAPLIGPLIHDAQRRTDTMVVSGATEANARPQRLEIKKIRHAAAGSVEALREEASGCRACPLWAPATQTVFGEGPTDAPVMFVGEQPGDQEDIAGRPFVGSAGRLFDQAMAQANVPRDRAYVTNAVKHFRFVPRGTRRIHQKPGVPDIRACRTWLEQEISLVKPRLIVALGATAAQSLFGKAMPVGKNRGQLLDAGIGAQVLITVHPSYLLRLPDDEAKTLEFAKFVEDLKLSRVFFAAQAA